MDENAAEPDFMALVADARHKSGMPCAVGEVLRQLDRQAPDMARSVRVALASPARHTDISRAFTAIDMNVSAGIIGYHRRGECRNCYERGGG